MAVCGISIEPLEPIVARDGRPFGRGQGDRMRSLGWPYPSTVAGSFRTLLGKLSGKGFSSEVVEDLKRISIHGPLPVYNGKLFLPQPEDFMDFQQVTPDKGELTPIKLRPSIPMRYGGGAPIVGSGEGCDLPDGILPCFPTKGIPTINIESDIKKKKDRKNTFWDTDLMVEWLLDGEMKVSDAYIEQHTLPYPKQEERMHVRIDPNTGVSQEGELFATVHLDMTVKLEGSCPGSRFQAIHLVARVDSGGVKSLEKCLEELKKEASLHPLGGERRLCLWAGGEDVLFRCPEKLRHVSEKIAEKIASDRGVSDRGASPIHLRMILATPAIFADGWKPGWLHEERTTHATPSLIGAPPGMPDLKLKLVSVCIPRWKPVSGYSLEKGRVGPKPIRRVVPAGAVYFFEVISGKVDLGNLWLKPVCDDEQDSRDGFGLAVWGLWH